MSAESATPLSTFVVCQCTEGVYLLDCWTPGPKCLAPGILSSMFGGRTLFRVPAGPLFKFRAEKC